MYEEISKKQNITPANCENRWKHLERSYKKYIDITVKRVAQGEILNMPM